MPASTTRTALLLSVLAISGLAGSALAQAPMTNTRPTSPRQGWAHKDGLVKLEPLTHGIPASEVADRLAIADSFARWGVAYDEGQIEAVRSLFTRDAVYQVANGSYTPGATAVGPEAIGNRVVESLRSQADQRRHAISNVIVQRLTANSAEAIAYGVITVAADGLSIGAAVIYRADLQRESDGAWRFSRFVIGMDDYVRKPNDLLDRGSPAGR